MTHYYSAEKKNILDLLNYLKPQSYSFWLLKSTVYFLFLIWEPKSHFFKATHSVKERLLIREYKEQIQKIKAYHLPSCNGVLFS